MPKGRPSKFTQAIADEICSRIANGGLITHICALDGFPCYDTFRKWRDEHDDFSKRIARAKTDQAEFYRDDIAKKNESMNRENWQFVNAQIKNTQWLMGKLDAAHYGDKLQHANSDGDGPLEVVIRRIGGKDGD